MWERVSLGLHSTQYKEDLKGLVLWGFLLATVLTCFFGATFGLMKDKAYQIQRGSGSFWPAGVLFSPSTLTLR